MLITENARLEIKTRLQNLVLRVRPRGLSSSQLGEMHIRLSDDEDGHMYTVGLHFLYLAYKTMSIFETMCKTLKCYHRRYGSYIVVIPDGIDDSRVAFQCCETNAIGRRSKKTPQRDSCHPHTTHELVIDAVT